MVRWLTDCLIGWLAGCQWKLLLLVGVLLEGGIVIQQKPPLSRRWLPLDQQKEEETGLRGRRRLLAQEVGGVHLNQQQSTGLSKEVASESRRVVVDLRTSSTPNHPRVLLAVSDTVTINHLSQDHLLRLINRKHLFCSSRAYKSVDSGGGGILKVFICSENDCELKSANNKFNWRSFCSLTATHGELYSECNY